VGQWITLLLKLIFTVIDRGINKGDYMKKLTIALMLGLSLILGASATSVPAHAATVNKSVDTYTIRYFDDHGKEKDWIGSKADAQKIIQKEDTKRLTALKNRLAALKNKSYSVKPDTKTSGYVNPNLNRVDNCTWPNSFLAFWNNGPLVCFANSGSQNVEIYAVYRVDSGNNAGSFTVNQGPAGTDDGGPGWVCVTNPISYGKNQTLYPPQNDVWTITSINNN
jgi:hypothetical protein